MRTFYDGEKEIQFVITQYKRYLHEYQHRCEVELQKRVTLQSIDMHIAEVLHMDYETVKKWHNTKKSGNGVGDLETIKKLATILGINYKALVKEVGVMKENNEGKSITETRNGKEGYIQQVFEALIEYIYLFAGKDYQALYIYDEPYKEMKNYEIKLYCLLDSMALGISDDTYFSLRKTISEVNAIVGYSGEGQFIPKEWKELNPYLGSPEFGELVEFSDSETDFYHIIDCHMYEEKDVNKYFHMLFEDVPDLVEIANSIQKDSDRDQYSLETLWENGNCSMTPPNELVVREISNTLIKLMKKRFVDEFA